MPQGSVELETKFNGVIKNFGIRGWTAIWKPDPTQNSRGQILSEAKTIIVYDEEPEAAMETLLHEALEIKLRPMLKPYRTLVNALIEWADGQVYAAKEKVIEDLLPGFKFIGNMYPSLRKPEEGKTN